MRHRRIFVVALLAASACTTGPEAARHEPRTPTPMTLRITAAPWRLPAPISREVVLPDGTGLRLLGGLTAADSSATGVFTLDPTTGRLTRAGVLAQPTHDAAGAVVAGQDLVFGGGSTVTTSAVQSAGHVVARLPRPRSDLVAATIAGTVYLAGGYDGVRIDPAVLATRDGHTFQPVATLPVPVRYPAVVASGSTMWLFGGQGASGDSDAIQQVDVTTGRASIVGHLPTGLVGASAFLLGGLVYIAGGSSEGAPTAQVLSFDPASEALHAAGALPYAVANAGSATLGSTGYLIGGETPATTASVVMLNLVPGSTRATALDDAQPFAGQLLIADRGNNRLLVVDVGKHVLWTYPSAVAPPPPGGLYFPDDAFFTRHGTAIISNAEGNQDIVEIGYPSGRLLWRYGHPHVPGAAAGYLHQPDDAYRLADGTVTVADALNCRILFISAAGRVVRQLGRTGACRHNPPAEIGYPNGDTPLANGDVLVSEVDGSWVTEFTPAGAVRWTVTLPIAYPSDPQQLGPDLYLIADYARPGGVYEFTRSGRIGWRYAPASGPGMLDHPSLAEQLPGGFIGVNDDYRHRVVIIDPRVGRIVWQYGLTDVPGTASGLLNIPDGFDLLAPGGLTPTHPTTG
jgi:hypothetical protein